MADVAHGATRRSVSVLVGEESHADWLEAQLELVRQLGDAHYLAQQIHD